MDLVTCFFLRHTRAIFQENKLVIQSQAFAVALGAEWRSALCVWEAEAVRVYLSFAKNRARRQQSENCVQKMRNICVLDEHDADWLRHGREPDCRKHRHVTRQQARGLVLGTENVPWIQCENWNAEAKWATLVDGTMSNRHIVLIQAWNWVKVTERTRTGAMGFTTLQLVPQNKR